MTTLSANVCRVKRSYKPYQNEHVSRRPEKKAKNHVMLTWKLLWKSFSTTHLPFLLSNPKILKAFQKTFRTKMKLTKCLAAEKKKWGIRSERRGEERKRKVKVKTAVSLLNPKTLSKFCFPCMPQLCTLVLYITSGSEGHDVYDLWTALW